MYNIILKMIYDEILKFINDCTMKPDNEDYTYEHEKFMKKLLDEFEKLSAEDKNNWDKFHELHNKLCIELYHNLYLYNDTTNN